MKRVMLWVLCAAVAAAGAFAVTRWMGQRVNPIEGNEIAWLQAEFKLSPEQVAAVSRLHAEYQPICREHCRKIQHVRAELQVAADPRAAQTELARVEAICQEATRAHLQRVAAVMEPNEGARFLELVLPKLAGQSHEAPYGLK